MQYLSESEMTARGFTPDERRRYYMRLEFETSAAPTGQTWTTEELKRDFTVIAFRAPYVYVKRKEDGASGTMCFLDDPRVYFDLVIGSPSHRARE